MRNLPATLSASVYRFNINIQFISVFNGFDRVQLSSGALCFKFCRRQLKARLNKTGIYHLNNNGKRAGYSKQRAFWFRLHHWVGLKLSVFMTFVIITGTLATISNEIDWLLDEKKRTVPNGEMLSIGEMVDRAQATYPDWPVDIALAPLNAWFAANITVMDEEGEYRRVYVDPYTGKVNGDSGYLTMQRFLREVHRNLMLPTFVGVPIVTSLAFLLFISLVSGLKTYKKFWRGFFKSPSSSKPRVFWGNIHRLTGLWSLPFLLLMILTCWWYFAESLGAGAPNYRSVYSVTKETTTQLPMAELQKIAETAYPELKVTHIIGNTGSARPIIFWGENSAILVRPRANFVAINPYDGSIVELYRSEQLNLHQKLSEMADPLHFGTFAGVYSKWGWFLLGILLTLLSTSGVIVFAKRIKKEMPTNHIFQRAISGMHIWFYISLGGILTVFIAWPFREY